MFVRKFWKALFKLLGTSLVQSTAYDSQIDGQSDIANRKVGEIIGVFACLKKEN